MRRGNITACRAALHRMVAQNDQGNRQIGCGERLSLVARANRNGTVTIWATTSTVNGNGDQGADPNKLVRITSLEWLAINRSAACARNSPTGHCSSSLPPDTDTTAPVCGLRKTLRGSSSRPLKSNILSSFPAMVSNEPSG